MAVLAIVDVREAREAAGEPSADLGLADEPLAPRVRTARHLQDAVVGVLLGVWAVGDVVFDGRAWSEELPVVSILHVEGEVDLLTAPAFKQHVVQLIGRGRPIIVDCSAVQYFDMTDIHVLEDCHQRADQAGEQLLVVGSTPLVHKILAITQLNQRVRLFATMAQALKTSGQEETGAS